MSLKKLLLAIAGGVAALGSFLPWAAVTFFVSVRANAFQMGEPLPIILAILALLCGVSSVLLNVLKEKQIKNIIKIKKLEKMPLFIGATLVAIAVIAFIYVKASTNGVANVSFGVWMIGVAGAATIVIPFLKNKELDKIVIGKPEKVEKPEKTTSKSEEAGKPEKAGKSDKKETKK